MQVEVVDLPSSKDPAYVKLDDKSSASLNMPGLHAYQLHKNTMVTHSNPGKLFEGVPTGTRHVVINTHGKNTVAGVKLMIAGGRTWEAAGIGQDNCQAVFAKLGERKAPDGAVVWISGCEGAADPTFCQTVVRASGCFLVAYEIGVPNHPTYEDMIDFWPHLHLKIYDPQTANTMAYGAFVEKQKELKFHVVLK
jgi:hypothetical protein